MSLRRPTRSRVIAALALTATTAWAQPAVPSPANQRRFSFPVTIPVRNAAAITAECTVAYTPVSALRGLAFAPGGNTLAVGGSREVLLWDLNRPALTRRLGPDLFSNTVHAVAFSRDGRTLAAGDGLPGRFGAVSLFDVESGRLKARFAEPTAEIFALAFSPDDRLLAAGGGDGQVHVWFLPVARLLTNLVGHTAQISGVAFSPDGRHLASCGADRRIHLWQVDGWKQIARSTLLEPVHAVAFNPAGDTLAFACGSGINGSLRFRRLKDVLEEPDDAPLVGRRRGPPSMRKVDTGPGIPVALAWMPPGSDALRRAGRGTNQLREYVAGTNHSVSVFNQTGALITNLWGHADAVTSAATTPDVRRLATCSADGTVKLWSTAGHRLLATLIQLEPHSDAWVIIMPQGAYAASSLDAVRWRPLNSPAAPNEIARRLHNPGAVRAALSARWNPPAKQPVAAAPANRSISREPQRGAGP